MATSENEPRPASAAPRSPKRAAQIELDELIESVSKRSKTASPEPRQEAEDEEQKEGARAAGNEGETEAATANNAPEVHSDAKQEPATATATATATAPPSQEPNAETPEARAAPKVKMCGICHENEGKYKCARCALPLIHRENHPPDPEPTPKPAAPEPPEQTSKPAADPSNPFSMLDDSDQLRYLFRRYPGLQARLLDILAATEPPAEMRGTGSSLNDMMRAKAMAAANPKKEQWTHDVGVRKGKEALRKARNAVGEEGEGVREYIELINHLVSRASEVADAEDAIRKQASQRDTDLIRRLMAEDRG